MGFSRQEYWSGVVIAFSAQHNGEPLKASEQRVTMLVCILLGPLGQLGQCAVGSLEDIPGALQQWG